MITLEGNVLNTWNFYSTYRETVETEGIMESTRIMNQTALDSMLTSKFFDNDFVKYCNTKTMDELKQSFNSVPII